MTRVLLVEDHASFRESLAFLLNREPDFDVVAQAGTVADAASLDGMWDVAVVDLGLPDGHGADVITQLLARNAEGQVMVLTATRSRAESAAAVEAGAAAIVDKSSSVQSIVESLRRLAAGESLMDTQEFLQLIRAAADERGRIARGRALTARLTPREREVLQSLADGLSNKEIARRLHISVETQRTHMVNILAKLEAHSQLQALVVAVRFGIVDVH